MDDVDAMTGERDTDNMAISDVLGCWRLMAGATDTEISDAIAALSAEDPALARIRTAVSNALGDEATDDLAADVVTLASTYADAKAVTEKAAAAGVSSRAEGFLYALAGRPTPANTNSDFTLVADMTSMKLEADGLAVSLNAEDGDSMFAKSANKQGVAPDLGGPWNKTVVENEPDADATTIEVAAVYSDAQGELPKSLILDEGGDEY